MIFEAPLRVHLGLPETSNLVGRQVQLTGTELVQG